MSRFKVTELDLKNLPDLQAKLAQLPLGQDDDAIREQALADSIGKRSALASEAISAAFTQRPLAEDFHQRAGSVGYNPAESLRKNAAARGQRQSMEQVLADYLKRSEAAKTEAEAAEAAAADAKVLEEQRKNSRDAAIRAEQMQFTAGENRLNRDAAMDRTRINANAQVQAAERAAGVRTDNDVQALAKLLAPKASVETLTNELQTLIGPSPKDIPGIGYVEGSDKIPDALRSKRAIEIRNKAQQLQNEYIHAITGAGGSQAEMDRIMQAAGKMQGDERAFLEGLKTMRQVYDGVMQRTKAGFRPEVVKTYEDRVNAQTPRRVTVTNGTETLSIDAQDLEDAKRDGFSVVE